MTTIDLASLSNDFSSVVSSCLKHGETITIVTDDGNAVLLSEDKYRSLKESLILLSNPGMRESISQGVKTPLERCEMVEWK